MDRFLSPGAKVRPKEEPTPKARGRPKIKAAEGALDLGEQRPRVCASNKVVLEEQRMREMERRLELLETVHSQAAASDEKVQIVLSLHEQAEAENKQLRELLQNKGVQALLLRRLTASPQVGFLALMELRSLVRALGGVRRLEGTSASWEVSWGTVRQP